MGNCQCLACSSVICPYKDKCTSFPEWCCSCKHNTGKKSYYSPDYYPIWQPYYPYYTTPYSSTIWCTYTSNTDSNCTSHYEQCST